MKLEMWLRTKQLKGIWVYMKVGDEDIIEES